MVIDLHLGYFRSPKSFYFMEEKMKEYKSNDELLNHLLLKIVIVNNKKKVEVHH